MSPISDIEQAARQPIPAADLLAGRFISAESLPIPGCQVRSELTQELGFGKVFTSHMARAQWQRESGWFDLEICDFGEVTISPAAAVLHYGQTIFEGIKAYWRKDGSVWTFRPGFNAARFNSSARRLAMPELPPQDFIASLVGLVRTDLDWVPQTPGSSLYLRPFMWASQAFLGVHAADEYTYQVIASPVGPYFKDGFKPVSIWVTDEFHRAGPGGMGAAKTAGNYASSLLAQQRAAQRGYQQVCFLDACENRYLEELGGMNIFVAYKDGTVATPALTGTILEGGTRSALITLLEAGGHHVRQCAIALDKLIEDIETGAVTEIFACGTAAVVTPIGKLGGRDFTLEIPGGPLAERLYGQLTDIQYGRSADSYGWTYRLA